MRTLTLKSTTALMLGMSLTTPALAQDATAPFPCVIGTGQTVPDAATLADRVVADLSSAQVDPAAPADPAIAACSTAAIGEAAVAGGAAFVAALATATPAQIATLLPNVDMTQLGSPVADGSDGPSDQAAADQAIADQAAADQAVADQAVADQAAADQAAADQAAVDQAAADQAAADQAAADQAAADQAAADQSADQAAADQAAADQAADQAAADQAAADQAAADQAAADQASVDQAAADQAAADQAAADQAVADQATADQAADQSSNAQPAVDPAPADQATTDQAAADQAAADAAVAAQDDTAQTPAETTSTIGADTSAETATPPAEPTVSDEERAARTAKREASRQTSAAATATTDPEEMANDPAVVTEDVSANDVRAADQDFATPVTTAQGAAAETAAPSGGLSTFEKALVLGLGALTVGAIVNNGDQVVSNSGDRVVVQRDGELRVLKNDDVLLRQPGAQVATRTFDDGSTLTTVTRDDGSVVTTIRAADGTVLRRSLTKADGTQVALIDDLDTTAAPVEVSTLPPVPQEVTADPVVLTDQAALQAALTANLLAQTGRSYSLEQVRDIRQLRALAPQVELAAITFETGSAAIQPDQANALAGLGGAIRQIVANDPSAIFLVEGHTDAVGDAGYNLALSDRRSETVALALSQYFQVPPENLVTQGYGEQFLKVQTETSERANRRAAVRNISDLLRNR